MDDSDTHPCHEIESHSSLLAKLPPDSRRLLDQALIDRDPPTYRAVFDKFKLADHRVSFTSFYYYARRIRHQADLLNLTQLAIPDDADVPAAIHQLVSHRLLESLLHGDPSPRALQRLADAYRIATATLLSLQRQKEFIEDAARKQRTHDADCFQKATKAFANVLHHHLDTLEHPAPLPDQPAPTEGDAP